MRKFRIDTRGPLPGSVIQGALVSLILLRRRLRTLVRTSWTDESSFATIKRLAQCWEDQWELEYWELTTQKEIDEYFGNRAAEELRRLKESSNYFFTATPKVMQVIQIAATVDHLFRVVRARDPDDWDKVHAILDSEEPRPFDPRERAIDDYLFAGQLDTEMLLRIAYLKGLQFGEIEGRQNQAVDVAKAGGNARAKKLKALEHDARVKIQRHIASQRSKNQLDSSTKSRKANRRLDPVNISLSD